MNSKKHIIVYSFQSLEDPLIKGLMLQYLITLSEKSDNIFHLITHEQKSFNLNDEQYLEKHAVLNQQNIFWYPIKYHNGRFLILKKIYDFLIGFWICLKLKIKYKPKFIIGFLPLAAGFSSIIAPILNIKLITYCFEPHSEYMADFGIWKRKSLKFILLKRYERNQLEMSKVVVVPTTHSLKLVNNINPYSKKFVLPISVDTEKNIFELNFRNEFREKHNLVEKRVILYMGKFGGIYYDVPTFINFIELFKEFDKYHFLIISPDADEVRNYINNNKIDNNRFTIFNFIPYEEINKYISIADIGVVAVPPLPSQKYRTPVKTGLYLSCGIPYLINKGVAEDDMLAIKYNIGVVVDDFTSTKINELENQISSLLHDSGLSKRCRTIAIEYRSHQKAVDLLCHILNNN